VTGEKDVVYILNHSTGNIHRTRFIQVPEFQLSNFGLQHFLGYNRRGSYQGPSTMLCAQPEKIIVTRFENKKLGRGSQRHKPQKVGEIIPHACFVAVTS
jgi:hypothetical protein